MDEQQLNELELRDEAMSKEVSISEKRALIQEAKKRYGKDYLKFFNKLTSKGSGIDWNMLRFRMG